MKKNDTLTFKVIGFSYKKGNCHVLGERTEGDTTVTDKLILGPSEDFPIGVMLPAKREGLSITGMYIGDKEYVTPDGSKIVYHKYRDVYIG